MSFAVERLLTGSTASKVVRSLGKPAVRRLRSDVRWRSPWSPRQGQPPAEVAAVAKRRTPDRRAAWPAILALDLAMGGFLEHCARPRGRCLPRRKPGLLRSGTPVRRARPPKLWTICGLIRMASTSRSAACIVRTYSPLRVAVTGPA